MYIYIKKKKRNNASGMYIKLAVRSHSMKKKKTYARIVKIKKKTKKKFVIENLKDAAVRGFARYKRMKEKKSERVYYKVSFPFFFSSIFCTVYMYSSVCVSSKHLAVFAHFRYR